MKRRILIVLIALAVGLSTGLLGGIAVGAQNMSDYASTPPFVFQAATPNILLLMDNSASMASRLYWDGGGCGFTWDNWNHAPCFYPTTVYDGYLDSKSCYVYEDIDTPRLVVNGLGQERFKFASVRTTVGAACPSDQWDGNFLNFFMFRRIDAVKKAMIGALCSAPDSTYQYHGGRPFSGPRNPDGTCPPIGSPAQVTLQGHRDPNLPGGYHIGLYKNGNPADANADNYHGRVPDAVSQGVDHLVLAPQNYYSTGFFCVDDDISGDAYGVCHNYGYYDHGNPVVVDPPPYLAGGDTYCVERTSEGFCLGTAVNPTYWYDPPPYDSYPFVVADDDDAFQEGQYNMRWVTEPESKGVIQQVGAKARLGLMHFKGDSAVDGGYIQVGIGAAVAPSATNNASIVTAVETFLPTTQTPLAETLYEAVRYVAQVDSAYGTGAYETAFSGTAGTEPCPPNFGYSGNGCSRDPYFHGSAWATPSAVVPCCSTFIILVTDGAPVLDTNIPDGLKEFAAGVSGQKCTGGNGTIHGPNGTCNTNSATPAATLLKEHRTDHNNAGHYLDDVALWAHTTDLRQATIPGISDPGHPLLGMQNVTLYTFYTFGDISGRELLMQSARQGGFIDSIPKGQLKGNSLPDLTGQTCTDPDTGVAGVSSAEWDKVNNRTGLTVPDCIPDNYFESSNVNEIQERLLATLFSILRQSSSGTSVSSQTTSTTGQGAAYQAYFFPSTAGTSDDVTWTGYTQALFVDHFGNLREDTVRDGNLILTEDKIIKVRFDSSLVPPRTVVDKYSDTNGTGVADLTTKEEGLALSSIEPIWEAGRRLALTDPGDTCAAGDGGITCRRILTWVDKNNDGILKQQVGEWLEFKADDASAAVLCPFLGGNNVADCATGAAAGTVALNEAKGIINFIRGVQVSGLRDRQIQVTNDSGNVVTKVWKLGDVMDATPVVVGAPRERYDVIYGDTTYAAYFSKYKDRRQMIYVGANDGMLHAFNGGFLRPYDDPTTTDKREELSFCTVASVSDCHSTAGLQLGAEKWAYIPHDLLPQLRWLTRQDYSHVYYVDLKPKVTDVRIFCTSVGHQPAGCINGQATEHPNGWGTILIGGLRMGGSCANCPATKGGPRIVTANFNGTTQARMFLSSYFVMDITDPEKEPVLLWTFRDQDLGFTTAAPAVIRVNNVGGTSTLEEQWHVVFGTGPTHYDGSSTQLAKIYTVDLKVGPTYGTGGENVNRTTGTVGGRTCSSTSPCILVDTGPGQSAQVFFPSTGIAVGFMGDAVTVDFDLDYRVDVLYAGSVSCNGAIPSPCNGTNPIWKGGMWRLTFNGGALDPELWGVTADGGPRAYTALISGVGPVVAAPALTTDDDHNLWVYFGTGRFYANQDNTTTDLQRFYGIKDRFISQGNPSQTVSSSLSDLYDATGVKICVEDCGDAGSGLESVLASVQNKHGWVIRLEAARERSLSSPVVFGGIVFFISYAPPEDICGQGGNSRLYAMFFRSGTGTPEGALGTTTDSQGRKIALGSLDLGLGVAQVSISQGAGGSGDAGLEKDSAGQGCKSGGSFSAGKSSGEIINGCIGQPLGGSRVWSSRIITWRDI